MQARFAAAGGAVSGAAGAGAGAAIIQTRFIGDGTLVTRNSTLTLAGDSSIGHVRIEGSALTLAGATALGGRAAVVTADAGSSIHIDVDGAQLGAMTLNGATLEVLRASGTAFAPRTTTLTSLAGEGGVLVLNADFGKDGVTHDQIVITDQSSGRHAIRLNHTGEFFDEKGGIWLIDTGPGAAGATFTLEGGTVDIGVSTYGPQQGDGSEAYPDPGRFYLAPAGLSNAADAILNTVAMIGADWHYSLDALYLRMGDLHAETGKGGGGQGGGQGNVWARARGYRLNASNKLSRLSFHQYNFGLSVGADRAFRGDARTSVFGAMIDMGKIDRAFANHGTGETSSLAVGVYAAWLPDTGWYADAILKADLHKNKFESRAGQSTTVTGDYDNQALGGSVEFGRRVNYGDGVWAEFGAQAALAWIRGETYDTRSATTAPIHVKVDGATATQYRLQMRFGRQLGNGKWNPYFKIAGACSNAAGGSVHAHTDGNPDQPPLKADYEGWRAETGAGFSYLVSERSMLYFDYEYAKAQSYSRPWSLNVGYRAAW